MKKQLLALFMSVGLLLTGCGLQTNATVLECSYPFTNDTDVMKYTFKFNGDSLSELTVYMSTELPDLTEDEFNDTVTATEDNVNVQDALDGVTSSFEIDEDKQMISQTVVVDFSKYDLEADELVLFGDKEFSEITVDFVLESYGESGYEIIRDGKKVESTSSSDTTGVSEDTTNNDTSSENTTESEDTTDTK